MTMGQRRMWKTMAAFFSTDFFKPKIRVKRVLWPAPVSIKSITSSLITLYGFDFSFKLSLNPNRSISANV